MRDHQMVFLIPAEDNTESGLGFRQLCLILWSSKALIAAITAAFAISAIVYALAADQWYKAEVVMVPAKRTQGIAGQLGSLAGLASIAGLNIGEKNESTEALAVLKSNDFAKAFIEERNLVPVLFADEWDSANGRWKSTNPDDWPDVRDAVRYFQRTICHVTDDKRTGLISVDVEWKDREIAANWANELVSRVNDRMRQRAIAESERNIKFLREELTQTNIVSLQQSISHLIETELQSLMIARGNDEFAFRVVDRAGVPKWRSRPKRTLLVILATIAGGMIACVFVIVRYALRAEPRQPMSDPYA